MSANPKLPAVELAVRTDPGRDPDKQVNEDAHVHRETALGLLAVVCDGMGGHAGGKEASELAIATIVEIIEAAPAATSPGVALKRAVEEANARIWSMPTAEAGFRPGSTVVAILAHPGGAEVAHVGDSRIYLLHAGAISQITRDHSMVQEMVDRNLIRAEDAAKHPDANKILRALGIAKEVEVELRPTPVAYVNGDVFVLCSDGLSDLVEPAEILDLASHPPAQAAGQLVDLANARGGHDNITAMVILMKATALVSEADRGRVAKTLPLTAVLPQDPGPTRTVVAAPMVPTAMMAPAQAPHPAPPAAPAPAARPPSMPPPSRTPTLVLGVVLAVLAVAIVGAVVVVATRTKRHPANLVDAATPIATTPAEPDDAEAPAPFVPAPPLSAGNEKWRLPDGGAPEPCGAYRRLRDRGDASTAVLDKLDLKCRQSGGVP